MTAPVMLDRETIRGELCEFALHWRERIDKWTDESQGHIEKSYAPQLWTALLKCFGISAERMDLFEQDARRASTGNTGYMDAFWPSVFLGEAKSPGKDLDAAYQQALDYLNGGSIARTEFPRYIVVTDFENFRVTRLGSEAERWTSRFSLAEVPDHVDELLFLAGMETESKEDEEEASFAASELMAKMYTAMLGDDSDSVNAEQRDEEEEAVQRTSMWLTRLLFLLFGDDAGLWEQDLFYRFVQTETTPATLGSQLHALFDVLNRPEDKRSPHTPELMARFPYVNGALFAEPLPAEFFTAEFREALLDACRFQWTRISPAVFGAMFQLVKSKEARRAAGEHYTSETNILKLLGPLFLDDYQARAQRLLKNKGTTVRQLRDFLKEMAATSYLDPACGCGNFLVVAYREMRAIETDILARIRELEGQMTGSMDVSLDQMLSIGQFHGFEINWWPAKIAEVAMFLVDHQANRLLSQKIGQAPSRLPIRITAHIHHADALEIDWEEALASGEKQRPQATFVFGNPPFLGDHTRTKEQLAQLQRAWGDEVTLSRLDYVTAWHAKTLTLMRHRHGEWAFVTTNSITQGDQVPRLFGPIFAQQWRIKFAHRTFAWDSEAPGQAAVHCVIVGFSREPAVRPRLWEYASPQGEPVEVTGVTNINAYLVNGDNVLVEKASRPISSLVRKTAYGSKPTDGGNLIVEPEDYDEVMADPIAAQYVRRFVGARELIHGADRWCLWLEDMNPGDVKRSAILRQRIEAVRDFRAASSAASTRDYPHHHLFRQLAKQDADYVCIPAHFSENRQWATVDKLDSEVISGNANFQMPDPDGLQFALISSSMFITWQKAIGGRLKSDLRFASTLTWYTFPVPDLDDATKRALIQAGQRILSAREKFPDRCLADHYGLVMDKDLVAAHTALDTVMDKAMGAPRRLTSDEQRLELLFANYSTLAG